MNRTPLMEQATEAEEAATAAHAKAAELEAGIIAGNTKVTIDMLEEQERKARAADLAARAASARITDAQQLERNKLLVQIRDEIKNTDRQPLVGLLHDVESAAKAFAQAATEYNNRVYRWRSQMLDAGVAEYNGTVDTSLDEGLAIGMSTTPTVYLAATAYQYIPNVEEITTTAAEWAFGQITRDPFVELSAYVPDNETQTHG